MSEKCQAIQYIKDFHDRFLDVKLNKDSRRPEKHFCGSTKLVF